LRASLCLERFKFSRQRQFRSWWSPKYFWFVLWISENVPFTGQCLKTYNQILVGFSRIEVHWRVRCVLHSCENVKQHFGWKCNISRAFNLFACWSHELVRDNSYVTLLFHNSNYLFGIGTLIHWTHLSRIWPEEEK